MQEENRETYNRPVVAAVPSGLSLTPLRIIIIIMVRNSNSECRRARKGAAYNRNPAPCWAEVHVYSHSSLNTASYRTACQELYRLIERVP
jgi:hypothetical protein